MSRVYAISKQENASWIFLDDGKKMEGGGYISYRNVICRALHSNLQDNVEIKKDFFDVLKSSFDGEQKYETDDFLSLYFLKNEGETSIDKIFMVDKTKGCFPLVFGKDNVRISALKEALDDIESNWISILSILKKYQEKKWKKEIEDELNEIYNNRPKKGDA